MKDCMHKVRATVSHLRTIPKTKVWSATEWEVYW